MFVGPSQEPSKYELIQAVSQGGEGAVWRARVNVDGIEMPDLAIKVINASNASNLPEWQERWQRQADILASLDSPGLSKVWEVFTGPAPHSEGESAGSAASLFMVMDWVEGPTLAEWVERNPNRDAIDTLKIIAPLASAIDHLHSQGTDGVPILHRDIKPSNIIISESGPVLVDFGFARPAGTEIPMSMVNTPFYTAPEAAYGYNEATDRFSLGATAFFALTGANPSLEDPDLMKEQLNGVKGLEGRDGVHESILAMLSRDPAERPASTIGWAQSLVMASIVGPSTTVAASPYTPPVQAAGFASDEPESKSNRRVLVASALVVFLGAAALIVAQFFASSPDPAAAGTVPIPNVVGLAEDDALQVLGDLGFDSVVISAVASDGEAGKVVKLVPAAGTDASTDEVIVLSIAEDGGSDPIAASTTSTSIGAESTTTSVNSTSTTLVDSSTTTSVVVAIVTPTTSPPATSPPATSPPATSPPTTSPPTTSPPTTSPPTTSPPTTSPPTTIPTPGTPGTPTASSLENTQSTVNWSAASGNGHSILEYEVKVSTGSTRSAGTATSLVWTGLSNGSSYTFTVRARSDGGWGAWSGTSNSATPATIPSKVGTPSVSGGNAQATISWSAPSTGGSPITNYKVEADTGANGSVNGTHNDNASPHTWTGLSNGTNYKFRVTACNAVGCGTPSNWSATVKPWPPKVISLSKGGSAQGQPGCSGAACAYLSVSATGLSANTSYSIACQSNDGSGWSTWYTYSKTTNSSGAIASHTYCYFGFPGHDVAVVIASKRSNVIRW